MTGTRRKADARVDGGGHAVAVDRLIVAAHGLARTLAETEALLQERADMLSEPTVTMRPTARRRFDLVPLSEAAQRLGRHPEVLRRWCAQGRIEATRIGRAWWLRSETLAVLAAHGSRARPRLPGEPTSRQRSRARVTSRTPAKPATGER